MFCGKKSDHMKQKYSRRIAKKVTNKLLIYDCNLPPEPWYRSKYWGKDVSIKRSLSCGRCGGMNNQRLTQTFTIGNCLKRSSEGTVHKCVGVRIRYAIQQENWHLFEMISFICCETQKTFLTSPPAGMRMILLVAVLFLGEFWTFVMKSDFSRNLEHIPQ